MPRTTSPDATAASASIRSLTASESLRSSSVSSKLSRSSGLIKTAAGRPLRVTTTRSCSRSTRSTNSENRSFTFRSESVVMATIVPRCCSPRNGLPGRSDLERGERPRCISVVSVLGAPGCVGLSGRCRSVRTSPQLDRYVSTDSGTDRHTPIPPFFRFGSRRPGVRISPPRITLKSREQYEWAIHVVGSGGAGRGRVRCDVVGTEVVVGVVGTHRRRRPRPMS